MADRFVKDPREVVKAGDVVKVRVKEVDAPRKRIALTMRSGAIQAGAPKPQGQGNDRPRQQNFSASPPRPSSPQAKSAPAAAGESAFAAALRKAQEGKR
jgi:uncharacterized protein